MTLLDEKFSGAIGHCVVCNCPMVVVAGQPRATTPNDTIAVTREVIRDTEMQVITAHHVLCPKARPS